MSPQRLPDFPQFETESNDERRQRLRQEAQRKKHTRVRRVGAKILKKTKNVVLEQGKTLKTTAGFATQYLKAHAMDTRDRLRALMTPAQPNSMYLREELIEQDEPARFNDKKGDLGFHDFLQQRHPDAPTLAEKDIVAPAAQIPRAKRGLKHKLLGVLLAGATAGTAAVAVPNIAKNLHKQPSAQATETLKDLENYSRLKKTMEARGYEVTVNDTFWEHASLREKDGRFYVEPRGEKIVGYRAYNRYSDKGPGVMDNEINPDLMATMYYDLTVAKEGQYLADAILRIKKQGWDM